MYVCMYVHIYPFQIRLDYFVPMSVLFVQQPKTKKNTLETLPFLRMRVQRTIIAHIQTYKNYVYLFSQLLGVSFYISLRNEKFE